jgi:hypothetical protein
MSTQAQTITIRNPIRWFMVGVAAALVAVAVTAGLALAILYPPTQPADVGSGLGPASLLDAGFRLQRVGEIGAGRATVSAPWYSNHVLDLIDQRKGEIAAGDTSVSGGSGLELTEHRRGEINGGN